VWGVGRGEWIRIKRNNNRLLNNKLCARVKKEVGECITARSRGNCGRLRSPDVPQSRAATFPTRGERQDGWVGEGVGLLLSLFCVGPKPGTKWGGSRGGNNQQSRYTAVGGGSDLGGDYIRHWTRIGTQEGNGAFMSMHVDGLGWVTRTREEGEGVSWITVSTQKASWPTR
jgi:hypothetical protein